jgi:hypothetical protein
MSKENKFSIFREKIRIGKKCGLIVANCRARQDALEQVRAGRNPTYIIKGPFFGEENVRIGKFSHGRIYWKFAN